MKDSFYAVLNRHGLVRTRKSTPDLMIGEIAIKLNIEVDQGWFKKIIPEGTISIPDTAVIGDGLHIDFDNATNEQLEQIEGCVKIAIEDREESKD